MPPLTVYKRVRQADAYHYTGDNAGITLEAGDA